MSVAKPGIPDHMRAVVAHAPGDFRLEEVEVPTPGPDELLVKAEKAANAVGARTIGFEAAAGALEKLGAITEGGGQIRHRTMGVTSNHMVQVPLERPAVDLTRGNAYGQEDAFHLIKQVQAYPKNL